MTDSVLIQKYIDKYKLSAETQIYYTDGSKMENGESTGIGIVDQELEEGYQSSINPKCSIYTAELLGIEMALGLVLDKRVTEDILILTDSRSACETVKNNELSVYKHESTLRIREKVNLIQERNNKSNKVIIAWIPGHKNILGNEDEIAKEATTKKMDSRIKVPLGDWKSVNKEREWLRTVGAVEKIGALKGRKYFQEMFEKEKKKPWFYQWEEERGFITMINRLRANHMNVKESLHRKGYIEEGKCDCGGGTESVEHLIF